MIREARLAYASRTSGQVNFFYNCSNNNSHLSDAASIASEPAVTLRVSLRSRPRLLIIEVRKFIFERTDVTQVLLAVLPPLSSSATAT